MNIYLIFSIWLINHYIRSMDAQSACGGSRNENSRIITSPNYPRNYENNLDCIWIITLNTYSKIILKFTDFSTEATHDYVQVFDGNFNGLSLGKFNGTTIPPILKSSRNVLTIKFHTDGSVLSKGFSAYFEVCGGPLNETTTAIKSPFYPSNYVDGLDCVWTISRNTYSTIILKFVDFSTEATHDYIQVFDGSIVNDFSLGTFNGTTIPPILKSASNTLTIKFHTDGSAVKKGFLAHIADCGGAMNETTTVIKSPFYPSGYVDNLDCIWKIILSTSSRIVLKFDDFETEKCCDYVEVFDGNTVNDTSLGTFKGAKLPSIVYSSTNMLTIKFHTDRSTLYKGFSAHYEMEQIICGGSLNENTRTIKSPNYPGKYPNYLDCIWTITLNTSSRVILKFDDFWTEECCDYLEVFDGNTVNDLSLGIFKGLSLPPNVYSTTNVLAIRFYTNSFGIYKGFSAHYDIEQNDFTNTSIIFLASNTLNNIRLNESLSQHFYTSLESILSIDYSYNQLLYVWSHPNTDRLWINSKSNLNLYKINFAETLGNPEFIAIDWIHDLIYWIDIECSAIKVIHINNYEYIYTILNLTQDSRDLLINAMKSVLIWSNIANEPTIMQSNQDGSNETLIYDNNRQAFHLTIDYQRVKYYFIDIQDFTLVSIDFNGLNEQIFITSPKLFYNIKSMSILEKDLFYSTEDSILRLIDIKLRREKVEVIVKTNKFNTTADMKYFFEFNPKILMREQIYAMKIINPLLQPEFTNKCDLNNCSHLCLPLSENQLFRCVCPSNMVLINDSICRDVGYEVTQKSEFITELVTEESAQTIKNITTDISLETINKIYTKNNTELYIENITYFNDSYKTIDKNVNKFIITGMKILIICNSLLIGIIIVALIVFIIRYNHKFGELENNNFHELSHSIQRCDMSNTYLEVETFKL